MTLPKVVIVGRPNVGKSSLFNWLCGRRMAIVDPTAGVTRDWMSAEIDADDEELETPFQFTLIDTGGMGILDSDNLTDDVEHQIQTAIDMADVILFVVDAKEGILSLDEHVANKIRRLQIPVLCVVNKTDHIGLENHANDFFSFGWDLISVSAKENRGRIELLNFIFEHLPEESRVQDEPEESIDDMMKIAIVGRRNVGKSTFVNTLVKFPRMIVSNVAGTTRDSVNVKFELDGKPFIAVDTPGFRRRVSVRTNIDYYGTHRAQRSIRFADVTLMFFDASQQISKVDKQLVGYIMEQNKPCIFVVNKWDLMREHMNTEVWADYLRDTFPTMWHVPIAFITGQTGKNVKLLLHHAQMLYRQANARVSTSRLNKLVRAALTYNPPPLYRLSRPKIYYATQVGTLPPTVVLFCNNPDMFPPTYRRYLLSVLRDQLDFGEVPIKLYFRKREKDDNRDDIDSKLSETTRQAKLEAQEEERRRELEEWSMAQEYYANKIQTELAQLNAEDKKLLEEDGNPEFLEDFNAAADGSQTFSEGQAAFEEEFLDGDESFFDDEYEDEFEDDFDLSDETFRALKGSVFVFEDEPLPEEKPKKKTGKSNPKGKGKNKGKGKKKK
ncbi:MAG: ribosome biogenesis GTPase Der [Thermoguttaceae bacterium]|nr:ribosome biogenesis GTPase Der [Thermoguttaceae bacterium]